MNLKTNKRIFSCLMVVLMSIGFYCVKPSHADPMVSPLKKVGLETDILAPDFTGADYQGKNVKLSDMYKKGPVVLIFYRGAWCPYCNKHLHSFQEHLDEIKALGADVLAVSVDKPEFAQKMVTDNQLGFDVITDPGAGILAQYNLIFQVPMELNEKYKKEYNIDLEQHSGRTDRVIAVPATYIIDTTGKIVFAYANEDYKTRTEPAEVISFLKTMQKKAAK